jgi:beta-1,4-N-acetylglucosaminyltransferase
LNRRKEQQSTRVLMARKTFETVFVTVGTTKFDALVRELGSQAVLQRLTAFGCRRLIVQTGASTLLMDSRGTLAVTTYEYKDSIEADIRAADLVIGHAGAGTILEVLRHQKPLIVVINGQLMDNHQLELADQMQRDGYLTYCRPETLSSVLASITNENMKPFPAHVPKLFTSFLDSMLLTD